LDLKFQKGRVCSSDAEVDAERTLDIAAMTREMVKGNEMAYRIFYDAYLWTLAALPVS